MNEATGLSGLLKPVWPVVLMAGLAAFAYLWFLAREYVTSMRFLKLYWTLRREREKKTTNEGKDISRTLKRYDIILGFLVRVLERKRLLRPPVKPPPPAATPAEQSVR